MAEEQPKKNDMSTPSHPRDHLCLCPPDPKIPRPRNSFILFRQHQQASILAQNPGIPNPEVSKIIGEQWRQLSAESKEEWNLLAEEEKARHQQQYPGYRYQPRRNGRLSTQSSVSGPSSAEPQEPCPKCGGKPMNYYSNQTPAYTPSASQAQQTMGAQVPAKRGYVVSTAPGPRVHGLPTVSPEHVAQQKTFVETYPFQRVDPRLIYAVPPAQALPTPPSSESQDAKRRRFNISGGYVSAREPYPEAPYAYAQSPIVTTTYARPEVLQQIHASQNHVHGLPVAKPAMMSPPRAVYPHPPQLQPIRPPQPHQRTRSAVALPPIETVVPPTPAKVSSVQCQSSGVEAMIMSIPVLNKVKVLAQISPPLLPPGPSSPKPEIRGAIIAIEGMDASTVDSMTTSLAEQLGKEGKFMVRIFDGPDPYSLLPNGQTGTGLRDSRRCLTTEAYLSMLSQWHRTNKEMVEFITTKPGSAGYSGSKTSPISLDSPKNDMYPIEGTADPSTPKTLPSLKNMYDSAISPKTITKAAELSIVSPPAKPRSRSTPDFSMDMGESTNDSAGGVQSNTCTPRPLTLAFPRPFNSASKRIPPPPPTPPPTMLQLPAPAPAASLAKPSWQMPPPSMFQAVSSASNPLVSDHDVPVRRRQQQQQREERQSSAQGAAAGNNAIPIALVPHYQLTTVDASSISMPISDGFSPPAHWQWFATLWRGSVGPDITVVIKGLDEEHESAEGARATGGSTASASTPVTVGGRDRTSSAGLSSTVTGSHSGVEIRLHDCRAVIVKTGIIGSSTTATAAEAGGDDKTAKTGVSAPASVHAAYHAKEMDNWEKAKRRVGFEVDEFLRR
ncbi:hypothetical protein A1O3_02036 [Capronia epimyces CBS 606.96]|uniref:HMG box domain-containing protein n=1 Tax=Capronia epimyces CBS 606.96 TaxID=1182542 RepID=W9Y803_9EURO|nr:uncharacterized protein A1O3_02036 [Capronia epimyces CBS 606.96]EXJ88972.1 hypothetical protein A1O3_02036 [Capronia epimyces CBS 606.96]